MNKVKENDEVNKDLKKMLMRYFALGIAKGIGMAIGFTILGAILVYILKKVVMLNLPVIGAFVRDIMQIVEEFEQK